MLHDILDHLFITYFEPVKVNNTRIKWIEYDDIHTSISVRIIPILLSFAITSCTYIQNFIE